MRKAIIAHRKSKALENTDSKRGKIDSIAGQFHQANMDGINQVRPLGKWGDLQQQHFQICSLVRRPTLTARPIFTIKLQLTRLADVKCLLRSRFYKLYSGGKILKPRILPGMPDCQLN